MDDAERDVLAHANENGKFVVPLGVTLDRRRQEALERLMLREWVRLIDISSAPTSGVSTLLRVFMVTQAARDAVAASPEPSNGN